MLVDHGGIYMDKILNVLYGVIYVLVLLVVTITFIGVVLDCIPIFRAVATIVFAALCALATVHTQTTR